MNKDSIELTKGNVNKEGSTLDDSTMGSMENSKMCSFKVRSFGKLRVVDEKDMLGDS